MRDTPAAGYSRRDLLRGGAGLGAASLAGCLGYESPGEDPGVDPVRERVTVDPADVDPGGVFRTAVGANPDSLDFPYSSTTSATIVQNLLYEGLVTTDASGRLYPWLAADYEQLAVQAVDPRDYEPYMVTAPYATRENGATYVDADAQILVVHPDDSPEDGDQARVLTVDQAPDAVADGTFGMHFRFDLREGVRFHDGSELTAADVVASYGRVEGSPLSAQVFDSLLHVAAAGEYAVDLYVQVPDAAAVRELATLPVYPESSARLPGGAMDPRQGNAPLGTGPFALEELADEEFVRVTRFEDYWFDTALVEWFDGPDEFPNGPAVDAVDVAVVPSDAQRSAALQEGELDLVFELTGSTLTEFRRADRYRAAATDGAGYTFLQYPVRVEPWDDPRLRRAINRLIPRRTVAENVHDGWREPAAVPLPPLAARTGTGDYDDLVERLGPRNEYDPDRARELVAAVLEDRAIDPPIEVPLETYAGDDAVVRTVELIAQSVNELDALSASVETTEYLSFVGKLLSTEYWDDGTIPFLELSSGFNPHPYAKVVHHPANFGQCCNFQQIDVPALNRALERARYGVEVARDAALRRQRYDRVWNLVVEQCANSYCTHSTVVGVVTDDVVGFNAFPSVQDVVGYALFAPEDRQITYLDR